MSRERFEPLFELPETMGTGIADKKIGEKIKAIVNYKVIEKTKNFTILKIQSFYTIPARRSF